MGKVAPDLQMEVVVSGGRCPPLGEAYRFDHIRAVGSLSRVEMQEHLERTMIYASPARYEPFGLSVLEAAACGAVMVSDAWEGLDRFFDPGSEILIAERVEDVLAALELSDCELWRIRQAAQERVLGEHTAHHRALELGQLLSTKRTVTEEKQ